MAISKVCLIGAVKPLKINGRLFMFPNIRGIYSYQKLIFFPNQVKLKVDFFPLFSREVDGVRGGAPSAGGSAPQAKIFLKIGYRLSCNFNEF